ncbi:MAG: hypothetical protein ACFFG0_56580 [Candidatus Thorarchaeota archaeon]
MNDPKKIDGMDHRNVCAICKKSINPREEILACRYCSSIFHRDHLLE